MARKQGTKAIAAAAHATGQPAGEFRQRRQEVGDAVRSNPAEARQEEIADALFDLRFQLAAAASYHAIRELHFARLYRWLTGLQVFLGTGAIAAMTDLLSASALWLVIVSALAGVILLVLDPAGAAREHRSLRVRLQVLGADLEAADATLDRCRAARTTLLKIGAEAPPVFRGAQAMAFNQTVTALYPADQAEAHQFRIGFWRRLFANVNPMRGHQFKKA